MGVTSSRQRTDPPPTPANDPTALDVGHVWRFGGGRADGTSSRRRARAQACTARSTFRDSRRCCSGPADPGTATAGIAAPARGRRADAPRSFASAVVASADL